MENSETKEKWKSGRKIEKSRNLEKGENLGSGEKVEKWKNLKSGKNLDGKSPKDMLYFVRKR